MQKSIHRLECARLKNLIKHHRVRAGMSQAELSFSQRRVQSYIADVGQGERRVELIQLADLCAALGVSLTRFVREHEHALVP